jgi:two-component system, chemotaxis family, protein-glutamate methylesterase/glutaminase
MASSPLSSAIRGRVPAVAVVLGGSAGAIEALYAILPAIPASTGLPVVVCIHLPVGRRSLIPELLANKCSARVQEVEDKQAARPGIWIAPPDYHLLVEMDRSFALSVDPPVKFSRPSIDVLFQSAADAYGAALVAVVLTGASEDGADGAKAVRDAGGFVAVQDPRTAEAPAMPNAAIRAARPELVAPLPAIAALLSRVAGHAE